MIIKHYPACDICLHAICTGDDSHLDYHFDSEEATEHRNNIDATIGSILRDDFARPAHVMETPHKLDSCECRDCYFCSMPEMVSHAVQVACEAPRYYVTCNQSMMDRTDSWLKACRNAMVYKSYACSKLVTITDIHNDYKVTEVHRSASWQCMHGDAAVLVHPRNGDDKYIINDIQVNGLAVLTDLAATSNKLKYFKNSDDCLAYLAEQ